MFKSGATASLRLASKRLFSSTSYKMAVTEVTSKSTFDKTIAASKLTVVDFHAVWCGPCKAIAPKIDAWSEEYSGAQFIKIDVDEVPDVAQEAGISAMPTVKFYKDGNEVGSVVGANVNQIHALLKQHSA